MPDTKSDVKQVIDVCADAMKTVCNVVRQFIVPLCIIKSNAKPGIKLLATLICWSYANEVVSAVDKAKKMMYERHSIEPKLTCIK